MDALESNMRVKTEPVGPEAPRVARYVCPIQCCVGLAEVKEQEEVEVEVEVRAVVEVGLESSRSFPTLFRVSSIPVAILRR